jgi:hypothetical protein
MKRLLPGDLRRPSAIARAVTRSSGWLAALCSLASLFLLGCPGTLDPGVGPGPGGTGGSSGGCEVQLLAARCAPCHTAASAQGGLDLQSADIPSRLVGHDTGAVTVSSCSGMKLLNAGSNPATGVFIDKLTMDPPPCGSPMPLGGTLTATEKSCLTDWATGLTSTTAFIGETSP